MILKNEGNISYVILNISISNFVAGSQMKTQKARYLSIRLHNKR
jgi:hypothetical protein